MALNMESRKGQNRDTKNHKKISQIVAFVYPSSNEVRFSYLPRRLFSLDRPKRTRPS